MLYPKFIIEGDRLILSKVTYHHQLVEDKTKVKGGGWFNYEHDTDTFIFSGESHDFGPAKLEDIKACVETGKVFSNKYSDASLAEQHNFAYNTGTELIHLGKPE